MVCWIDLVCGFWLLVAAVVVVFAFDFQVGALKLFVASSVSDSINAIESIQGLNDLTNLGLRRLTFVSE